MSISQPKLSDPSAVKNELTERKLPVPFKSVKRIKGHSRNVYECTNSITFPDGKDRIISCSNDNSLRIFNLEEQKCEKIINHTTAFQSIHFYEEEQLLMTADYKGELIIWELFPEIKIIKIIQVAETGSFFWRITQISENDFFCCVEGGSSIGCLYTIKFNKNNNDWTSEEIDYPITQRKEAIRYIYQLISQKNKILFTGGNIRTFGGEDFTIKSINLKEDNNNNFRRFPKKHLYYICCITSYIHTKKNEEIIISGGADSKILFWNIKEEYLKEMLFPGPVNCFLNDFSRNNIFVAGGYKQTKGLQLFSTETEEMETILENIHGGIIFSMSWINEENQNTFISCSTDKSFNIYDLEEICSKVVDIEKGYDILEKMSDCQIQFKNKKISFWNTFLLENKNNNETLKKFEEVDTSINEMNLLSIIMGNEVRIIPLDQLPDYYVFFKKLNFEHCIAAINRKIQRITDFKDAYILFKDFCLKYENEAINNWFFADSKNLKTEFNENSFDTSFALSLFNRMREMEIGNEKMKEMIKIADHKDFELVKNKNDSTLEYYFKKRYDQRADNSNLTLVSTDKKEFKVHKEILILNYDFFFLLFRFRGAEVTEYEKTGKITLVDLMSSDVVECLISFAYLDEVNVKNEEISAIETFCKLLIFCDQFNEQELMKAVRAEFSDFVSLISEQKSNRIENDSFLKILTGLSNYLIGNDRILRILVHIIATLGFGKNDRNEFIKDLILQSMTMMEDKNKEIKEIKEKTEIEKNKLKERNLELEKMVASMKEEDDEGVGKGQIREREDDGDEEINKDQPKRKKRKINEE